MYASPTMWRTLVVKNNRSKLAKPVYTKCRNKVINNGQQTCEDNHIPFVIMDYSLYKQTCKDNHIVIILTSLFV
jgi:hypothetical protein